MITDILLSTFAIIIGFVISPLTLLADVTIPVPLLQAVANVKDSYSSFNPLFPVDTLLGILGIIVAIELAIFTYKAIYWLIKKIPTIS
jgi:hypothetical protein